MNITLNQTNKSKEDWFESFGSTPALDSLIVYVLTPLSLIGFLLNILSFKIFNKPPFQTKPIFSYLKVYSINSAIISLVSATYITATYNFFEITNTFEVRAYASFFYIPIYTTGYFYSSILDIFISLERLFNFYPKLNKFEKFSSRDVCLILFVVVVVIISPYFFIYYPSYLDVRLNLSSVFRIYYIDTTSFGKSYIGLVLVGLIFFIKDVLILLIEILIKDSKII